MLNKPHKIEGGLSEAAKQYMRDAKIDEHVQHFRTVLKRLEELEHYEACADLLSRINTIENRDVKAYIDAEFDVKGLAKEGFFKKGATYQEMEAKIVTFFELSSIFEYSLIGNTSGIRIRYTTCNHS